MNVDKRSNEHAPNHDVRANHNTNPIHKDDHQTKSGLNTPNVKSSVNMEFQPLKSKEVYASIETNMNQFNNPTDVNMNVSMNHFDFEPAQDNQENDGLNTQLFNHFINVKDNNTNYADMHNLGNNNTNPESNQYNQGQEAQPQSFTKLDIKNWFLAMAQDDVMIDYMYTKLCNVHRQGQENYNQYFKAKKDNYNKANHTHHTHHNKNEHNHRKYSVNSRNDKDLSYNISKPSNNISYTNSYNP